jgi:hypothetical protein
VGWPYAIVSQNVEDISTKFIEIDSVRYIMFDAIPDGGDIVLTRSNDAYVKSNDTLVPAVPILSQNYPNPFNPDTKINFQLPMSSHITLRIINSVGQEIAILANKCFEAGHHTVSWDGLDKNDNRVASGVYYYQLSIGDFLNIKKMILLR